MKLKKSRPSLKKPVLRLKSSKLVLMCITVQEGGDSLLKAISATPVNVWRSHVGKVID